MVEDILFTSSLFLFYVWQNCTVELFAPRFQRNVCFCFCFCFFLFFPFLFFTAISRCISSAMILLPSDNKKMLIKGSDITDWDYALTYSPFSSVFRYEISTKFSFLGSAKRNFLPLSRWGRLAKTSTITGYTEKKKEIHVISRLFRYTCF